MIHKLHYYNLAKDEISVQMKRVGNYTTTHLCPHEEPNFYYVLALCHKKRLVTSELVQEYFMTVERPVVNILLLTYNTFIMDEIEMGGITIDVNEKTLTVGGYSFDIINIDVEELYQNLRELLNDFNVKFINRIERDF